MHTRWPIFAAFVGGIAAVAALWFFLLSNPEGEAVPASGGRYTEGVTRAPERINPLFATNSTDQDLCALVFNGLVRLGPDGTPLPDLAERWEITGNGTSYVFHLRQGVAWHDGADNRFDAEDVVYTFRTIADPGFKGDPVLAQLMQGVVVTARDPQTVEFRLEQAYAPFLAHLTVGILPAHLLRDVDANALMNSEFNARPVGTGPYRLKDRTEDAVVLERNDTYHFGPPRVSTLEFRIYPDRLSLTEALHSGDIDGALLPPTTDQADLDFLRKDGRFALSELAATSMNIIFIDTRSPLFSDAGVRRALQQAINLQTVIKDAAGGRGVPADTGIPATSWAYTPVETPAFDPGAAARALEAAGWQRGRDGVRRKGDQRFSFALTTTNEPQRVAVAENVAQQLGAVGIEVEVQPLEAASYVEEHLLARQYQAALAEIDPGPDPDPYPFWHSSQIAPPGRNLANFSDPQLDDVLERARQTTDAARRKELYELYEGYLVRNAPALPLYAPVYTYVRDADVQGFQPSLLFTTSSRLHNVHEWYVKTRVR